LYIVQLKISLVQDFSYIAVRSIKQCVPVLFSIRCKGPNPGKNGRKRRKLDRSGEDCGGCDVSNAENEEDTSLKEILEERQEEGEVIPDGLEREVTVDGFVRVEDEAGEEEPGGEERPEGEYEDEEV
jgi:hypothetical protein